MITDTYITIRGLRVFARHGVMAVERAVGNEFLVDAVLYYAAEGAMRSDSIDLALNYANAISVIKEVMQTASQLLENVVERIINRLCEVFPAITRGTVTVTKVKPPVSAQLSGVSFSADFSV